MGRGRRAGGVRAAGAALVFLCAALAAPAAFGGVCDPVMPVAEVSRGATGTGWTVSRGRDPEPFSVEILGVLPNELGPGRDMILIEASSPAIQRAGGIWFGMSGSPVYVGGRLVGAVAYGFGTASGPSAVAGLTAAEDMVSIIRYSTSSATGGSALPAEVELPWSARLAIGRASGTAPREVGATMTRLRIPFSVSGLSGRGLREVERFVEGRGLALLPYAGASSSPSAGASADPLQPGDNFAAVVSSGDITTAGVGTATYVCDNRALAFGHPFFFTGSTSLAANGADVLTVVSDPFWGPFKMALITDSLGRVDQDRGAGVRAVLGAQPSAAAITTVVAAPDVGGRREGATDVFLDDMTPFVTFLHLLSNIDSTFDKIGRGSSSLTWTIEGTRADGRSWQLTRSNVYASASDIAVESSFELAGHLDVIARNGIEDVRVTSVRLDANVEEQVRLYSVRRVLVAVGRGRFRAREVVRAQPGQRLRIRVVLDPFTRGPARTVNFSFRLPRTRGVGFLEVGGGGSGEGPFACFLYAEDIEECGEFVPEFESFDEVLRLLASLPRNDVVRADLRFGRRNAIVRRGRARLDGVVRGGGFFVIAVGTGSGEEFAEGEAVYLP